MGILFILRCSYLPKIGLSISLLEMILSTKDAWVLFVCFVVFFILVGIELLHLPKIYLDIWFVFRCSYFPKIGLGFWIDLRCCYSVSIPKLSSYRFLFVLKYCH